MIIEITKEDDHPCRILVSEVVGFEIAEYVEPPALNALVPQLAVATDPAPGVPMARLILRDGGTRWAKYETLTTLTTRLTAARGGVPLHVHALDPSQRPAPVIVEPKPVKTKQK